MKTYSEQLIEVQRAISEIETNGFETELEVNGNRRRVKRADLATLYKRESWLKKMIDRESGAGTISITLI